MQITGDGRGLGLDFLIYFHLVSLLVLWTWVLMGLIAFLFDSKIPHSAPLMFADRVLEVLFGDFIISFHICFLITLGTSILLGFIFILCKFIR